MKTIHKNNWFCPKCGSTDVEMKGWIRVNEVNEHSLMETVETDDCWCNNCQEHISLWFAHEETTLEEVKSGIE